MPAKPNLRLVDPDEEVGEQAPYVAHQGGGPYVGHPAPPTLRGWIAGGIIGIVALAVIVALSSLPEIVGWFR